MTNTRVLNLSRGYSMKHKQALKAIENCACVWVEVGVSIRDLTLAESIAARNEQARKREPLALAEIPGLVFRMALGKESAVRNEYRLAREADIFAHQTA